MRLPDVARGPVALKGIDYAPRMSDETAAFAATICFEGIGCAGVRNDGRGGMNEIEMWGVGRDIERAVDAYAKALPPYRDAHGDLPMNGDFLVSLMVDEAISAREAARGARGRTAGERAQCEDVVRVGDEVNVERRGVARISGRVVSVGRVNVKIRVGYQPVHDGPVYEQTHTVPRSGINIVMRGGEIVCDSR